MGSPLFGSKDTTYIYEVMGRPGRGLFQGKGRVDGGGRDSQDFHYKKGAMSCQIVLELRGL